MSLFYYSLVWEKPNEYTRKRKGSSLKRGNCKISVKFPIEQTERKRRRKGTECVNIILHKRSEETIEKTPNKAQNSLGSVEISSPPSSLFHPLSSFPLTLSLPPFFSTPPNGSQRFCLPRSIELSSLLLFHSAN